MHTAISPVSSLLVPAKSVQHLQKLLLRYAVFNLFIVACLGLLLRSFPFLSAFPFQYKNLLHGHSHFAFGGWVMPALLSGILKSFPQIANKVTYKNWRNVTVLLLVSAYGMLLSFPFQGYGTISIIFSTVSIIGGIYMAILIWKATSGQKTTSMNFLRAGLFYLVFSSIGPFATGPLIAMGRSGSVLYYDVIYFYLHFQYNGWFTFSILSMIYKAIEDQHANHNGKKAFLLFNLSIIPAYLLSTLWSHPPVYIYYVGGLAGMMQVVDRKSTRLNSSHDQ